MLMFLKCVNIHYNRLLRSLLLTNVIWMEININQEKRAADCSAALDALISFQYLTNRTHGVDRLVVACDNGGDEGSEGC